jgi:hypothetical protein
VVQDEFRGDPRSLRAKRGAGDRAVRGEPPVGQRRVVTSPPDDRFLQLVASSAPEPLGKPLDEPPGGVSAAT